MKRHDKKAMSDLLCSTLAFELKSLLMRVRETVHAPEVEKVFLQAALDLGCVLVLDGIEILPDGNGVRIRCHDMHGPLPELAIDGLDSRTEILERARNRACWLAAISGIRNDLSRYLRSRRFLPPTTVDGKAVAGFRAGPLAFLEEGEDFLAAYHKLHERIVGSGGY
jgi:hypothetical protein